MLALTDDSPLRLVVFGISQSESGVDLTMNHLVVPLFSLYTIAADEIIVLSFIFFTICGGYRIRTCVGQKPSGFQDQRVCPLRQPTLRAEEVGFEPT